MKWRRQLQRQTLWIVGSEGGNEEEGDERQLDGIVTFRARQGKMQIVKHATQLKAAPKWKWHAHEANEIEMWQGGGVFGDSLRAGTKSTKQSM